MSSKSILKPWPMPTEHSEQKCLMDWWNFQAPANLLPLLFAIPNGGRRDAITGARMKAEGVRPGIPDLFLAVPAHGLHGLWIEMKRKQGGKLSEAQKDMQARLAAQGYAVTTCYGMNQAIAVICRYLGMKA